jgi:hypothetical protein
MPGGAVCDFSAVKRGEYEMSALALEGKYTVQCMCKEGLL